MVFRGLLGKSLGNFLCIRGFASITSLAEVSTIDERYQRNLMPDHKQDIADFLKQSQDLFFPEVILCCVLPKDAEDADEFKTMASILEGQQYKDKNSGITVSSRIAAEYANPQETRGKLVTRYASLEIPDSLLSDTDRPLFRIDGNHRLSAVQPGGHESDINTPFCILLFLEGTEALRHQTMIFHNINAKARPLNSEENLKVILDDAKLFPDSLLKESAAFGWPYYLSRKIQDCLRLDYLDNIAPVLADRRNAMKQVFECLIKHQALEENDQAVDRVLTSLRRINSSYSRATLKNCKCTGTLSALLYFDLTSDAGNYVNAFIRWIEENHLHHLNNVDGDSLIVIFKQILEARSRKVFVSMPFNNDTKETYDAIKEAVNTVNDRHKLSVKVEPIRIDDENNGHSFTIPDRILEVIEGCGLLIADLTQGNKNVYHELGYLMGLNAGRDQPQDNFLLIIKEQPNIDTDRAVGFNMRAWQQIRFTSAYKVRDELIKSLEKYYELHGAILPS